MVTEARLSPEKAFSPMKVTPSGMMIEEELVVSKHEKALCPMILTLLGIIVLLHPKISSFVPVLIMALQLSRESYTGLFGSTTMELSLSHIRKADCPSDFERCERQPGAGPDICSEIGSMDMTVLGMVIEVRFFNL
jgi:hypothetical protein